MMVKNRKGFTLIELLAVITIMGILMVVAIPTVSRTIENTRRDMFLDTAKQYVNAVKTMWMSDSLECKKNASASDYVIASALPRGDHYVVIDSEKISSNSGVGPGTEYPILLESGGKSSWGSRDVKGYVLIDVEIVGGIQKVGFSIRLTDGEHGIINTSINYNNLKRADVLVTLSSAKSVGGQNVTLEKIIRPGMYAAGEFKRDRNTACREV